MSLLLEYSQEYHLWPGTTDEFAGHDVPSRLLTKDIYCHLFQAKLAVIG